MSDLTEYERAEVEHDLAVLRQAEESLLAAAPVSPDASIRRAETLGRLRVEIRRVEGLLPSGGASE